MATDTSREKLSTYRAKRSFDRTPEPSGDAASVGPSDGAPRFVVQRHRARRLHYDLRFEIDGVLVSWAVPKGLTLDPSVRHLAVHVEDHPLDYFDFEGVIPAGEYGGGDVIVWDEGTWELHKDADARQAIENGELHAELFGQKVRGRIVLIRTRKGADGKEQWLLLHKRDEHAVEGWDPEEHPMSVLSGRTNDEVARAPDREWTRDGARELRTPVPVFEPATGDELRALDELGAKGTWHVQGTDVHVTNLDKVLFAGREGDDPLTKRDLIRYFVQVAPVLLPHLAERPLNLHRFPDGVDVDPKGKPGFWQKQLPQHAPDWMRRWKNPDADADDSQEYAVVDSVASLAWLGNHAAVELHAWTSRTAAIELPTYALVDIDPGGDTTWDDVLTLARLHHTALEHLGVRGYPKTSGQRGLQVWIPIAPGPTYAETRAWVEQLSRAIGKVVPDLVSWTWTKGERGGKARLDYTQNVISKTLVAPYSARPAPGAPVSMPISWDELDDPELRSDRWTIRTTVDRIDERGDLMAAALDDPQRLPSLD
jgi:bifunctional non-homologous end joining protein LigD